MSIKTITKFIAFVIFVLIAAWMTGSCDDGPRVPKIDAANALYDEPRVVGQIASDEITESSGLAASPCQAGIFWTHNDSGDGPYIYALSSTGEHLGVWRVAGADNIDWEDMAAVKGRDGSCWLYIGEIGNTEKLDRSIHSIYRVIEPSAGAAGAASQRQSAQQTAPAEQMQFKYPDGKHDAETLLVHPNTGAIYVLTKKRSQRAGLYKVSDGFTPGGVMSAAKLGQIAVPAVPNGLLTGGSISPDGERVLVCDYAAAYELTLPSGASGFDEIWRQIPVAINLGNRKQGEAVSYSTDGRSIFATSEKKNSPLIEVRRKQ